MNEFRIMGPDYRVEADPMTHTVVFQGVLRLEDTKAYQPIADLVQQMMALDPEVLTLDLRKLSSMNSSGINSMSKFLMKASKQEGVKLVIKASKDIAWQDRMLRNIQRVVPGFELDFD